jgi:hypothetical protein
LGEDHDAPGAVGESLEHVTVLRPAMGRSAVARTSGIRGPRPPPEVRMALRPETERLGTEYTRGPR